MWGWPGGRASSSKPSSQPAKSQSALQSQTNSPRFSLVGVSIPVPTHPPRPPLAFLSTPQAAGSAEQFKKVDYEYVAAAAAAAKAAGVPYFGLVSAQVGAACHQFMGVLCAAFSTCCRAFESGEGCRVNQQLQLTQGEHGSALLCPGVMQQQQQQLPSVYLSLYIPLFNKHTLLLLPAACCWLLCFRVPTRVCLPRTLRCCTRCCTHKPRARCVCRVCVCACQHDGRAAQCVHGCFVLHTRRGVFFKERQEAF